jgi:lysophospholipase L1-like esterase
MHVVLLGDSIFDNGSYTRGEPDVVTHLRSVLPAGARATLCAVDGATTAGLARQLTRVPPDATHLVVAIGGNDALGNVDLLDRRVSSTAEALTLFADRVDAFETAYQAALAPVLALGRRTAVCTIYNGNLEPARARIARVALTLFNDVIVRFGFEHRLPTIDLRLVCCDAADYANPIEPSGPGGLKIARAIVDNISEPHR